jgi:two-component system response regulator YesN
MYDALIVDDDELIRNGIETLIDWNELDVAVRKASDGTDAIRVFERTSIDILITDVCMPEMSGLDLIRWVKSHSPNTHCIVISSFSDFSYVKQAARLGIENYILKPIDDVELKVTVSSALDKIEFEQLKREREEEGQSIIQSNILMQIIKGDLDEVSLRDKASFIGFNMNCSQYLVASLLVPEANRMGIPLNSVVRTFCKSHAGNPPFLFNDIDGSCNLIYSGDSIGVGDIVDALSHLVQLIHEKYSADTFAYCSSNLQGYSSLAQGYAETRSLWGYSLLIGTNTVISQDFVSANVLVPNKRLAIDHQRIRISASNFDSQGLIDYALELMDEIVDIPALHSAIAEFISTLVSESNPAAFGRNEALVEIKGLFSDLYDQPDRNSLSSWISQRVLTYLNFENEKNATNNRLVQRLKGYVGLHYSKDINLKTIASEFQMNAFYLGRVFKDHCGTTFRNYINEYRLEKAKELLLGTSVSVAEIAEKTGYINVNYFYTLFKKVVGYSPTAYREKYAKSR